MPAQCGSDKDDRSPTGGRPMSRRGALKAGAAGIAAAVAPGAVAHAGQATPVADSPPLPDGVLAVMRQTRYRPWTRWGLHVADLTTGDALFDLAGGDRFVPGSTTKLFPTSAALARLGPDHRFVTRVFAVGAVADETLAGDLVLVAAGDLAFGGRTNPDGSLAFGEIDHTDANALPGVVVPPGNPLAGLDDLAAQVAAASITRIEGDVVIDDRLFPSMPKDGYVISPIVVNDNVVDVLAMPAAEGEAATVRLIPETALFPLAASVSTGAAGSAPDLAIGRDDDGRLTVSGSVPADGGDVLRVYEVQDPAAFARACFIEALARAGVNVAAQPTAPNPDPTAFAPAGDPVATLESAPLAELVKVTLKVSLNIWADTLVMLLGAGNGDGSWDAGFAAIRETLTGLGVDPEAISLADGRGNERADMFSPRSICDVLRAMAASPEGEPLADALPILGVDGTETQAVPADSPVRGKAAAKSGTTAVGDLLNQQILLLGKASAGYMTGASGRRVAYGVFVNDVPLAHVEEIMATIADQGAIAAALYEVI